MSLLESVCNKLRSVPTVEAVYLPRGNDLREFLDTESSVVSDSMPMRNDALTDTLKREHHLIVVQNCKFIDDTPHHALTWENRRGDVIAYDIADDEKEELEKREDLLFLADNFVLKWMADFEGIVAVLHASPVSVFGEADGICDVIAMYPALPVDQMIRSRYNIRNNGKFSTAVLSFNECEQYRTDPVRIPDFGLAKTL